MTALVVLQVFKVSAFSIIHHIIRWLSVGYHVGRLRLVFRLSEAARKQLIPDVIDPGPLAYVEWFSPFTQPDPVHGMYKVVRERDQQHSLIASVVEVKNIRWSCHLFPAITRRDGVIPWEWSSSTVLDSCEEFWLNCFSDMPMYMTLLWDISLVSKDWVIYCQQMRNNWY